MRARTLDEARLAIAETLAATRADEALGDVNATIARIPSGKPVDAHALPPLALSTDDGELVDRGILGRGGMGVVHIAEQRSLGRQVAVKRTRATDADQVAALLREARIMGGLEHPNVVPVHALGIDADRAPLIVMKRIDGVSWGTLLEQPDHDAWRPLLAGHGDRLRAQVEILVQICRALSFAHERGIVHRDLKPANVMIGRHGEVSLLDWGVALRLADRATEPRGIVGTPGYLAPEMALGDPMRVDERTDVYLLGATLYEVLAGHTPHRGESAVEALASAMLGEHAPLPADAPEDLGALVSRAMATEPDARIPSAEAFREELARHLASHEADLVIAEGRAAIARADAVIAREGLAATELLRALIEARFAFTSALRIRADDGRAKKDLRACLVRLVESQIALRSPAGARAFLAEIDDAPQALATRIASLERELSEERARSEAHLQSRREADSSMAFRSLAAVCIVLVIIVVPGAGSVLKRLSGRTVGVAELTLGWGIAAVIMTAGFFIARRRLFATEMARKLVWFFVTLMATTAMTSIVSFVLRNSMRDMTVHAWIAAAGVATLGAIAVVRDLWPLPLVYLIGSFALVKLPAYVIPIQGLVVTAVMVVLVYAFYRHARRSRVGGDGGPSAQVREP